MSRLFGQTMYVCMYVVYMFLSTFKETVKSPGPASSFSSPEGATSLPPGLINFTPHTCLPTHHSQLVSIGGLFIHLTPIPLSG